MKKTLKLDEIIIELENSEDEEKIKEILEKSPGSERVSLICKELPTGISIKSNTDYTVRSYERIYQILEKREGNYLLDITNIYNDLIKIREITSGFNQERSPKSLLQNSSSTSLKKESLLTSETVIDTLLSNIGSFCVDSSNDEYFKQKQEKVVSNRVKVIGDFLKEEKNHHYFNKIDSEGKILLHKMLGLYKSFDADFLTLAIEKTENPSQYLHQGLTLLDILVKEKLYGLEADRTLEEEIKNGNTDIRKLQDQIKSLQLVLKISELEEKIRKINEKEKKTNSDKQSLFALESDLNRAKSAQKTFGKTSIEDQKDQKEKEVATITAENKEKQSKLDEKTNKEKQKIALIVNKLFEKGVNISSNGEIVESLLHSRALSTDLTKLLCLHLINKDNIDLFIQIIKKAGGILSNQSSSNSSRRESGASTPREIPGADISGFTNITAKEIIQELSYQGKLHLKDEKGESIFTTILKAHLNGKDPQKILQGKKNQLEDLWGILQSRDYIDRLNSEFFDYVTPEQETIFYDLLKTDSQALLEGFIAKLKEVKGEDQAIQILNKTNASGNNLLHIAASIKAAQSIIQVLIKEGVQKDQKNNYNQTPLHIACSFGLQHESMELLYDETIANDRDIASYTALHYAVEKGYRVTTESLLKRGAIIDPVELVDIDDTDSTDKLESDNPDVPIKPLIFLAIEKSHETILESLLKAKANPDQKGIVFTNLENGFESTAITAIDLAIKLNNFSAFKILVENGAKLPEKYEEYYSGLKPDQKHQLDQSLAKLKQSSDESKLNLAVEEKNLNKVLELIEDGVKITPNCTAYIKSLNFEQRCEIDNAKNKYNLDVASEKKEFEAIVAFIEYGTPPTQKYKEYVDELEKSKNAGDKDKLSILTKALYQGEIVSSLVKIINEKIEEKSWSGPVSRFGIGALSNIVKDIETEIKATTTIDAAKPKVAELEKKFDKTKEVYDLVLALETEIKSKKPQSSSSPSSSFSASSFISAFLTTKTSPEDIIKSMEKKLHANDLDGAKVDYDEYQKSKTEQQRTR